jgi:hypothetical protein
MLLIPWMVVDFTAHFGNNLSSRTLDSRSLQVLTLCKEARAFLHG